MKPSIHYFYIGITFGLLTYFLDDIDIIDEENLEINNHIINFDFIFKILKI